MKAIALIIIVFFSFVNLQAQETTSSTKSITTQVKKELVTKTDYYNALIKANKFDIKLKKSNSIAKSGYYNRLLIKNGFKLRTKKSSRLAYFCPKKVSLLRKKTV